MISGQNTNLMSDILFYFSDYVITIYVIISRAIIATPSVRRTVRRCVWLSPSNGHTSDIPRTYSGQTPGTSMNTGHNPGPSARAGRYRRVNTTLVPEVRMCVCVVVNNSQHALHDIVAWHESCQKCTSAVAFRSHARESRDGYVKARAHLPYL